MMFKTSLGLRAACHPKDSKLQDACWVMCETSGQVNEPRVCSRKIRRLGNPGWLSIAFRLWLVMSNVWAFAYHILHTTGDLQVCIVGYATATVHSIHPRFFHIFQWVPFAVLSHWIETFHEIKDDETRVMSLRPKLPLFGVSNLNVCSRIFQAQSPGIYDDSGICDMLAAASIMQEPSKGEHRIEEDGKQLTKLQGMAWKFTNPRFAHIAGSGHIVSDIFWRIVLSKLILGSKVIWYWKRSQLSIVLSWIANLNCPFPHTHWT